MGKRVALSEGLSLLDILTSPKARKVQVAIVGILLTAATMGLFPPAIAVWVILIINTLTAAGVFAVPNTPQTLVLQPAGTSAEPADVVIETPTPAVEAMFRGDVVG